MSNTVIQDPLEVLRDLAGCNGRCEVWVRRNVLMRESAVYHAPADETRDPVMHVLSDNDLRLGGPGDFTRGQVTFADGLSIDHSLWGWNILSLDMTDEDEARERARLTPVEDTRGWRP